MQKEDAEIEGRGARLITVHGAHKTCKEVTISLEKKIARDEPQTQLNDTSHIYTYTHT